MSGTFTFDVGGRTVSVPVGACAHAVEVPAGTITITEHAQPGMVVTDISTFPSGRTISRDLSARSITVAVAAGDLSSQTVVTFANAFEIGQLKVCKVAGEGVTTGTNFSFSAGDQAFTVPAGPAPGGFCRLAGSFPAGTNVTVTEHALPGTQVAAITVAPAGRVRGHPDLAGRTVTVAIGAGVTEVTFTNRSAPAPTTTTTAPPTTTTTTVPPTTTTTTTVPPTTTTVPPTTTTTTAPPGGVTTTSVPTTAPQLATTTTTAAPVATTTTLPGGGVTTTSAPVTAPPVTTTTTKPPRATTTTAPGGGVTTTSAPVTAPQVTTTTSTTTPGPGPGPTTTGPTGGPAPPKTTPPGGAPPGARPLARTGEPAAALLLVSSAVIGLGFLLVLTSRLGRRPHPTGPAEAPEPVDDFARALADPFFLASPRSPALTLSWGRRPRAALFP